MSMNLDLQDKLRKQAQDEVDRRMAAARRSLYANLRRATEKRNETDMKAGK